MRQTARAGVAGLLLIIAAALAAAQTKPPTLFLSRDAVVEQSPEQAVLVDAPAWVVPTIVVGAAPAGPRQGFDAAQLDKTARIMATYLG